MERTLWMPPVSGHHEIVRLMAGLRLARHSGEFAAYFCALRDLGYGVEDLYGRMPSGYRPIAESAPQIRVIGEIVEIFRQFALLRTPVSVLTTASDTALSKAIHMISSPWVKSTHSFHLEPLVPVHIQINPCISLGTMRHFAYSYCAHRGVLPPDKLMDQMIVTQAKQLFSYRPRVVNRDGICFENRNGWAGRLFGTKQQLEDTPLSDSSDKKIAEGWV